MNGYVNFYYTLMQVASIQSPKCRAILWCWTFKWKPITCTTSNVHTMNYVRNYKPNRILYIFFTHSVSYE